VLALLAGVAVLVASVGWDATRELVAPAEEPSPAPVAVAPDDAQLTAALVVTAGDDAPPVAVVVLVSDRQDEDGTVLLVPAGTVADVPGHGSFTVGDAATFGGADLVGVTLDNLLDVRLDAVAAVDHAGLVTLGDRVGPVEVEVRSPVVGRTRHGDDELRLPAGPTALDGPTFADLVTVEVDGETELERLPRVHQAVRGLLAALHATPGAAEELVGAGADAVVTATDPPLVAALLDELASAAVDDRVTTLTLPVAPLGTGRDDLYRVDAERAEQVVVDRLGPSRPDDLVGAGQALQVLNGNGVPGIGQQVAERLQPGGYRIVLTGNADRFTHEVTRIVLHDDDPAQVEVARDIQRRLGVGEIERSGTPQSVVDLTIVVGRDFPPEGDPGG
jgi:anionic cell wall polymer biosynthesis LytR-Cps2A-Psr (LCP) family protein